MRAVFSRTRWLAKSRWLLVTTDCRNRVSEFSGRTGSAGLIKISAAWLIEKAGFAKGYAAGTSRYLIEAHTCAGQPGGATAAEVRRVSGSDPFDVSARFSIRLQMEPVMLGFLKLGRHALLPTFGHHRTSSDCSGTLNFNDERQPAHFAVFWMRCAHRRRGSAARFSLCAVRRSL